MIAVTPSHVTTVTLGRVTAMIRSRDHGASAH